MITQERLEDEIRELESSPVNLRNCEQLAVLRYLHSTYYAEPEVYQGSSGAVSQVPRVSGSEFIQAISEVDAATAWQIMDEAMETMQLLYPKMYNSVMRKIKEIKR